MGWKILIIENEGKLYLRNKQLILKNNNKIESVPIEDIELIILENKKIDITHPLLNELVENNILLFTTNQKY